MERAQGAAALIRISRRIERTREVPVVLTRVEIGRLHWQAAEPLVRDPFWWWPILLTAPVAAWWFARRMHRG